MKADAETGNFEELNREAGDAHAAGRTRPTDEIRNES